MTTRSFELVLTGDYPGPEAVEQLCAYALALGLKIKRREVPSPSSEMIPETRIDRHFLERFEKSPGDAHYAWTILLLTMNLQHMLSHNDDEIDAGAEREIARIQTMPEIKCYNDGEPEELPHVSAADIENPALWLPSRIFAAITDWLEQNCTYRGDTIVSVPISGLHAQHVKLMRSAVDNLVAQQRAHVTTSRTRVLPQITDLAGVVG